jgi:glycosyltransferase involved in cell wall biosynthesis
MIRLSICIATRNRAEYLIDTIKCLLEQLDDGIEIVIVDGASTDNSKSLVDALCIPEGKLRYFFEDENSGVDGDFDKTVKYALGQYCWLFSDDDILAPGALEIVKQALNCEPDVLIVNSSVHSINFGCLLSERILELDDNKIYENDSETAFLDLGSYLSFIGAIVVRRDFWLSRERLEYHGSAFAHLGVIFQYPLPSRIKVISAPLIKIRYGNSEWAQRGFDIWSKQWPRIVESLDHLPLAYRQRVAGSGPLKTIKFCLLYRALGLYDLDRYKMSIIGSYPLSLTLILGAIALISQKFINSLYTLLVLGKKMTLINVYRLSKSPAASWFSVWIAKKLKITD